MAEKEPSRWITVNGKHIPVYDDADEFETKKQREIAKNKEQADRLNGKQSVKSIYDKKFGYNDNGLRTNSDTPYEKWGDVITEALDHNCGTELLSPHKGEIEAYLNKSLSSLLKQDSSKSVSPDDIVGFVNDTVSEWMDKNWDKLVAEKKAKGL